MLDILIWVWTLHKGFRRAPGHPIQIKSPHTLTMYTPFFFSTSHKSSFFLVNESVSNTTYILGTTLCTTHFYNKNMPPWGIFSGLLRLWLIPVNSLTNKTAMRETLNPPYQWRKRSGCWGSWFALSPGCGQPGCWGQSPGSEVPGGSCYRWPLGWVLPYRYPCPCQDRRLRSCWWSYHLPFQLPCHGWHLHKSCVHCSSAGWRWGQSRTYCWSCVGQIQRKRTSQCSWFSWRTTSCWCVFCLELVENEQGEREQQIWALSAVL